MTLTKTADAATVDAGDPIGFTITVANGGPGTAKSVTLDDPLPAGSGSGVTWSINSGPTGSVTPTCSVSNGSPQHLTCSAVDLASGGHYTLHVTATTSFAECTKYDNTATAHATNAPDATGSASITCDRPSLSVTKTADAATVNAGDPIGFTITVANAGPGTAKSVTLDDPLPAGSGSGVTWSIASGPTGSVTPTCSVGSGSPQHLTCSAVDLASGGHYTLHVTATTSFRECTKYDNTATAHATNAPDATGSASISCLGPGLTVIKTADASTVNAGDPVGFTIAVSNGGPGTATSVTLHDPLPAGTAVAVDDRAGLRGARHLHDHGCRRAASRSTAPSVDMAASTTASVHIISSTSFANCTTYDNTATASATNAPDASDSASITCNAPSLTVTKTADAATVNAGDPSASRSRSRMPARVRRRV